MGHWRPIHFGQKNVSSAIEVSNCYWFLGKLKILGKLEACSRGVHPHQKPKETIFKICNRSFYYTIFITFISLPQYNSSGFYNG